jgi:hypothetical protein
MKHELKIWPQYFHHVATGAKTFEVRKNDRGFQNGDQVVLREWDPTEHTEHYAGSRETKPKGYTGKELSFKIGYVFPLDDGRVIFSLLKPY